MNIQEATPIILSEQERSALEAMLRASKTEHGTVERARIVLLATEGRSTRSIAAELGTWPGRVSRWRKRFANERLAGLSDLPRPGATARYGIATDKRILALLDQPPPAGYGRWTAPLPSRELGDVSDQYICPFDGPSPPMTFSLLSNDSVGTTPLQASKMSRTSGSLH